MMTDAPSAEMQAILDRLMAEDAGVPDPTLLPAAEGRAATEQANIRWNRNLPEMLRSGPLPLTSLDGTRFHGRLHVPHGFDPGLILYIHGGGWAFCSAATHERAARVLALSAGVPVLTFDYRLAPEDPFPAGLDDCIALWRTIADGHPDLAEFSGPRAIAGDSAGANLGLSLMLHELSKGRPVPEAGLFFYGVYGADFDTESYQTFANGPGLTRDKMKRYWAWYVEDPRQRTTPFAAPICADDTALSGLPPLYLNAAALDPLRSDTERLVARLRRMGRADRYRLHHGVVHGFMQMTEELAEARAATLEAGTAFRELVGLSERSEKYSGGRK